MLTGDQIRRARQRAGLSQAQLGARVGVSMRSIGNYERGETIPRNKMPAIEDALADYLPGDAPGRGVDLREISDARLLAEIARRFDRGQERHDDQAPTNQAVVSTADESDELSARRERESIDRAIAAAARRGEKAPDHWDQSTQQPED